MNSGMLRHAAWALCFSAVGCSVLNPLPDRSRFFTLTPVSASSGGRGASDAPSPASPAPTFGLGPVKLPAYLDRNELAMRVSPTEITYSTTDRWAEPLEGSFPAVLLQNLSVLLDTERIVPYPWTGAEQVDYQVEIEVLQFDNDTTGNTRLLARWRVKELHKATYPVIRETNVVHSQPPRDGSEQVTSLSNALGDLSRDIAGALQGLPAPAAPPPSASGRK